MSLSARRFAYVGRVALLALATLAFTAGHAVAQRGKKAARTYCFVVSDVDLEKGIPSETEGLVRKELTSAIAAHPRLTPALPDDAPDPKAEPKQFERYAKKRKLAAYRLNVEVTQYSHEVQAAPGGGGQRLVVSVALRTFGETIPQRVMAFSGEGSATIRMDIGKRLRDRDSQVASRDAAQLAVADALKVSLERLEAKKRTKGKKRKRRPRKK